MESRTGVKLYRSSVQHACSEYEQSRVPVYCSIFCRVSIVAIACPVHVVLVLFSSSTIWYHPRPSTDQRLKGQDYFILTSSMQVHRVCVLFSLSESHTEKECPLQGITHRVITFSLRLCTQRTHHECMFRNYLKCSFSDNVKISLGHPSEQLEFGLIHSYSPEKILSIMSQEHCLLKPD